MAAAPFPLPRLPPLVCRISPSLLAQLTSAPSAPGPDSSTRSWSVMTARWLRGTRRTRRTSKPRSTLSRLRTSLPRSLNCSSATRKADSRVCSRFSACSLSKRRRPCSSTWALASRRLVYFRVDEFYTFNSYFCVLGFGITVCCPLYVVEYFGCYEHVLLLLIMYMFLVPSA